jgi:hypothetical protein
MMPTDQGDDTSASCSSSQIWRDLVEFVQASGGHVHSSLQLDGTGQRRGLVATSPISGGELLIRLPASCVISGETLVQQWTTETTDQAVSPWLLCLGAYLRSKQQLRQVDRKDHDTADNHNNESWIPYFQSLPATCDYETIFQWTLEEIKTHLNGTTLGRILEMDRTGRCTEEQYRLRVAPFLNKLGLVDQLTESNSSERSTSSVLIESPNYQSFLDASMCIATRGFHLKSYHDDIVVGVDSSPHRRNNTPDNDKKDVERIAYNGPFLLPVIDLLNHDPPNSCTTLQRDPLNGSFWMVSERPLSTGEDVVHSYGDDLTSAQLLQTFGFVPLSHTQNICTFSASRTDQQRNHASLTPAYLRKIDHLLAACQMVKSSWYPKFWQDSLMRQKQSILNTEDDDDDIYWDVQDIPDRPMDDSMPDEFLVITPAKDDQSDSNYNHVLTEEIITFVAIQFLPEDAYLDIFSDGNGNCAEKATLDRSILFTDCYLRKLFCRSMILAMDKKINEYSLPVLDSHPLDCHVLDVTNRLERIWEDDQHRLKEFLTTPHGHTIQEQREMYGRTIRLEELTNMRMLFQEVEELLLLSGVNNARVAHEQKESPP